MVLSNQYPLGKYRSVIPSLTQQVSQNWALYMVGDFHFSWDCNPNLPNLKGYITNAFYSICLYENDFSILSLETLHLEKFSGIVQYFKLAMYM